MVNKNIFFMYLLSKKNELVPVGVLECSNEGVFELHPITTEDDLKILGYLSKDEKIEEQYFLLSPSTLEGITKNRHFKICSEGNGNPFRDVDVCEFRDSISNLTKGVI